MVAPSLLLAGETKRRFLDLKMGAKALAYLPLTVLPLLIFTIFAVNFLSEIPVLNASWLGYNIAIGPFGDHDFAIERCGRRFEIVSRLAGTIVRRRLAGIVAHVIDEPARFSPCGEQSRDVLLGFGVVPCAPAGMIDGFLHIDHDQRGGHRQRRVHQKLKRSASCMNRAGRAMETTPKSAAPKVRPGTSKFAWLSRL